MHRVARSRVGSEQMIHNPDSEKKPHSGQLVIPFIDRKSASAISSGRASRDWTSQRAIRSALRGPIPGKRRSCRISSCNRLGYSILGTDLGKKRLRIRLLQAHRSRFRQICRRCSGLAHLIFRRARFDNIRPLDHSRICPDRPARSPETGTASYDPDHEEASNHKDNP